MQLTLLYECEKSSTRNPAEREMSTEPCYEDHPDTGCKAGGPSCLDCKLPRCCLEEPKNDKAARATRDATLYLDYQVMAARGHRYVDLQVLGARHHVSSHRVKSIIRSITSLPLHKS